MARPRVFSSSREWLGVLLPSLAGARANLVLLTLLLPQAVEGVLLGLPGLTRSALG